jgi:hypothetical protein
MTIKTLGKNTMGIVLALLLVLLLSESRLFNFFTDTYLGRVFLIFIILIASYLNKILGVVCVFIIIIMFSNISYYEGFDSNSGTMEKVQNIKNAVSQAISQHSATTPTSSSMPGANGGGVYNPTSTSTSASSMPGANGGGVYNPTSSSSSMPGANGGGVYNPASTSTSASSMPGANGGGVYNPTSTSSSSSSMPGANGGGVYNPTSSSSSSMPGANGGGVRQAIEGFDLQSTENNIKRGKQSNSIPVNSFLMQSPSVAPYESVNFSENFGVL